MGIQIEQKILMVMFVVIATLPAMVNEFFLLPMFAQSGVEAPRSLL